MKILVKKTEEMSLNTPTLRKMVKKLGITSGYATGEPLLREGLTPQNSSEKNAF